MGMKHYPAAFKADAVALYRSRPGATIKSVAGDLGVNGNYPASQDTSLSRDISISACS
ncbi:transposase (plasmid) [Streptomyces microflavus]|uniref:Transposase n=2 Tax=Streptomyces microflavus TaxID=1919 RepID=A0A7H8MZL1_STRMI|nr:transposase [Streptomyces microflavus]